MVRLREVVEAYSVARKGPTGNLFWNWFGLTHTAPELHGAKDKRVDCPR